MEGDFGGILARELGKCNRAEAERRGKGGGCCLGQSEGLDFGGMSEQLQVLPSLQKFATEAQRQVLPYEPVCALFRRYLHDQKLKFTPERAMILDAALRKQGLFEPEQLVSDLKAAGHRASRATVYRTLNHLQDAGILKQVFFDNKQSYYEVIAGRQVHDYLICVATGKVIEFHSDKLRQLRDEICQEHGFEALSHRFQILGLSPEGKKQTGERPGGAC